MGTMPISIPLFLRTVRHAAFTKPAESPLTLVLGNTSADLDSFISAVVYAYFHSRNPHGPNVRLWVPLLNLTDVPSSDLWRLRPEYGTALRLALVGSSLQADDKDVEKTLLAELVTLADIRRDPESLLHAAFVADADATASSPPTETPKQDLVLVDHNAPQIPGLSNDTVISRFTLQGAIDHHLDEHTIPDDAQPRLIKTGIGSCTSLVISHLRSSKLWPEPGSIASATATPAATSGNEASDSDPTSDLPSLARLALAPILIDTANLTATGDKISPLDHDAVAFLEAHINRHANPKTNTSGSGSNNSGSEEKQQPFDRTAFYNEIQAAKTGKLDLLSMDEIFESDYKAWSEVPASSSPSSTSSPSEEQETGKGQTVNIGIASLVRDLPWLVTHAGSAAKLVNSMVTFARDPSRDLKVLILLTKGNEPGSGAFRKEVLVLGFGGVAGRAVEGFEREGSGALDLKRWSEDETLIEELGKLGGKEKGEDVTFRVWWQGDVSKSRKQVAPLIREAVKKA